MEPSKIRRTPSSHAQGLEGKEISSPSGRGREMSLTSPLIDRDVTPVDNADWCLSAEPSAWEELTRA